MIMETLLLAFTTHLERLGYSQGTQRMLPTCVAEFIRFSGCSCATELTPDIIRAYHQYLGQRPHQRRPGALSEMMIHHHMYALRVFFDYLEQTQVIALNPASGLHFASPRHGPREILTLPEIHRLFDAARSLTAIALLHLCYSCGLRRTEAEHLNVTDVHFRDQLLYVRQGKGGKRRVIPLTPKVGEALKLYYHHERPQHMNIQRPTEAFLVNRVGTRTQGQTMAKWLNRLLKEASIERVVTLHGLRHSIATHLLEQGMSLEYVRDFLGHDHLESTQVYTHVSTNLLSQWNSRPTYKSATPPPLPAPTCATSLAL